MGCRVLTKINVCENVITLIEQRPSFLCDLQEILSLEPDAQGVHEDELLHLCRDIVTYSVQTCHPHFKNQLYGGTDPYGLAGAWLAEALNTNMWVLMKKNCTGWWSLCTPHSLIIWELVGLLDFMKLERRLYYHVVHHKYLIAEWSSVKYRRCNIAA